MIGQSGVIVANRVEQSGVIAWNFLCKMCHMLFLPSGNISALFVLRKQFFFMYMDSHGIDVTARKLLIL